MQQINKSTPTLFFSQTYFTELVFFLFTNILDLYVYIKYWRNFLLIIQNR